jgi:transcriptional regulator with XRE-family HTH domain
MIESTNMTNANSDSREMFGRRLRALRESCRFSQWEAAQRAGVTANTWLNWEKGYTRPDGYRIPKLAELLSVTEEFLMTGAEAAESEPGVEDPDRGSFAAAVEEARRNLAAAARTSPERLRLIVEFL